MSQVTISAGSIHEKESVSPDVDIEQRALDEKRADTIEPGPADEAPDLWHPSQFPDGGKDAYLCLLGASCCMFCSFGWLNAIGVFQTYYQTNQLRDYSPSTVAWIPSIQIFMMFLPGPIVGWVFDNYGPKHIIIFGTFFHVFGLMMTSLCTEYYQFILAQGICSPLGLNCIFQAGTSSVPSWFLKRRGMAYGILAAGSGLGGLILPIMASHLIPSIGFAWTMRTIAFLILGLLIIAALTIKSRLPPKPRAFQLATFVEPFSDPGFVILVSASFLFFMGYFIPLNFIEIQAIRDGMSTRLAGYLLSVLNASSIFGRIIPGILADKFGVFNMQALFAFASGIIVLALGLPARSNAAHITFAALYGFSAGAYVALLPGQVVKISKVEQVGIRVGVQFACVSFAGLIGNPIAGAIVSHNNGEYWGLNVFAGVVLLGGGFMFVVVRMYVARWKLAVRI